MSKLTQKKIRPTDTITLSGQQVIEMIERISNKLQSRPKNQHSSTKKSASQIIHDEFLPFCTDYYTAKQIHWMREFLSTEARCELKWPDQVVVQEFLTGYPDHIKDIPKD
jgi:hypothetical protein